jgi:hypothetical protein
VTAPASTGTTAAWARRVVEGRGVWPAVPAVVYLVVALVLPLCVLFAFGFLTIERGRVVPGSFTLAQCFVGSPSSSATGSGGSRRRG